jgi:acyl-coenzyme A synthetase/AMP-(fatty) acid ligase
MRPRVYHFVDDFPRTPTNKINRRVIRNQLTSKG